ncbi:hypothetical protein D3C79_1045730 [compost metagenome]
MQRAVGEDRCVRSVFLRQLGQAVGTTFEGRFPGFKFGNVDVVDTGIRQGTEDHLRSLLTFGPLVLEIINLALADSHA